MHDRTGEARRPIGEDDETLRVLNFSGGGFDTVMQLGVTHALLVNQGKAPHVVVGVSAGAIQAAALAETLKAGTPPDGDFDAEVYRRVLGRRVARFRQFEDACNGAPQSIVDAVVPDVYQVDSFEPLASLRLPRLSAEEREERDEWIRREAGLVRLYNDLLSIDLPFGAATRLVRRWLGMKAAKALASRVKRAVLRTVEFMRLWLVIGTELRRLTPAVPVLARPLVGSRAKVRPSTAGSIIFKFRPIETLWSFVNWLWSFLLLLSVWVAVSWLAVLSPFLLTMIPLLFDPNGGDGTELWYLFYFLYLLPIVLPITPIALTYDKTRFGTALRDLSKGLSAFFYYLVKWTLVLALLLFGILLMFWLLMMAGMLIWRVLTLTFSFATLSGGDGLGDGMVLALIGITLLLVIVRPLVGGILALVSFRRSRRAHGVSGREWYLRKFLDYYRLGPALAHNYNLKRLLVDLFDPDYYGNAPMEPVLSESLSDTERRGYEPPITPRRRTLGSYRETRGARDRQIVVAVTTADVGDGRMTILDQDKSIVDGLLAATAFTPVFPPVRIGDRLLIDAYHVGNTPTKALVELCQESGLADVADVHVYAVDPLPVSKPELGPYAPVGDQPYVNLLDIVMRALKLQRYRDATIERALTNVMSDSIPAGHGTVTVPVNGGSRKFFRADYVPVELEFAPDLNRRIMFGDKSGRRRAIQETIAAGCRASLQVMHADVIAALANDPELESRHVKTVKRNGYIDCRRVMEEVSRRRDLAIGHVELPGSGDRGPGLAEVCRHCRLCDDSGEPLGGGACQVLQVPEGAAAGNGRPAGGDGRELAKIPDWPHELAAWPADGGKTKRRADVYTPDAEPSSKDPDEKRPSIACLFSGGVFRGVFQLGVLNALSLLEARPRIVAGASVGSITAAMVAAALSKDDEDARNLEVAKLAAVYVGIDRIILTDRFADFIRNWTIRASETKFSLRQLDRVFRKYDEGRSKAFRTDLRQVLAGIERLFYVNPYQINRLTRAIRNRRGVAAARLMQDAVQQWLDRMDVGEEVLGAEPIRLLIEEFVIPERYADRPEAAPFDCLHERLAFLATATNLTRGSLTLLASDDREARTTLIEGLLASSAFPGVFRPRRSWDLQPGSNLEEQFIDGGVMDNLPLHPVLKKIRELADGGELPLRSRHGPHLMLAASLQVDPRDASALNLDVLENYWPHLMQRATELEYNTKLDNFERVASNIQKIHHATEGGRVPLSVKVLAVKPHWLCNTFAFHPMLGFRRGVQAESIAHGCAATLLAFGRQEERHVDGWQLRKRAVPAAKSFDEAMAALGRGTRSRIRKGECWLQDVKCPFSAAELRRYGSDRLDANTRGWLSRIHESCWKRSTHLRR